MAKDPSLSPHNRDFYERDPDFPVRLLDVQIQNAQQEIPSHLTLLLLSQFPYLELLLGPYNRRLSAKAKSMVTTALDNVEAEANMSPGDTVHDLVDR